MYPENYKAATKIYLSLSDEQREVVDELEELGGHALHLVVDNSRKISVKNVVKINRANHRDSLEDPSETPDPSKWSIAPRRCLGRREMVTSAT